MDDQEYQLRIPFKSAGYYPVNSPAPSSSQQPAPSPLMFWALVFMASAAFAPCVVVPRWQDYRALKTAEQLELRTIEKMRDHTQHQELRLQGLLADPLVVARLAQRELEYRRWGERSVPIAPTVRATVRWFAFNIDLALGRLMSHLCPKSVPVWTPHHYLECSPKF